MLFLLVSRVRHFINLTNGVEALPSLPADVSFVRIQSSHCEANAFYPVLENLDHNLLFHLATGSTCLVYDFGSRDCKWPEAPGTKIPRALWWGLEWSRYALERLWHLETSEPLLRGYAAKTMFDTKLGRLPKPLYRRLKYYRKFNPEKVDLRGIYLPGGTLHDGDDEFYAKVVDEWCAGQVEEDVILPAGFKEYRSSDYKTVGRGALTLRSRDPS